MPLRCRLSVLRCVLGVLITVVGTSCSSTDLGDGEMATPDFVLTDLDGETFQLSSTQGSVLMLHFFAPWCTVCQAEAPAINAVYQAYKARDVAIVGVAVAANSVAEIETFVDTYQVPYRVLVDDQRVSTAYEVRTVPKTYFIARSGRIDRWFNGSMSKAQIETVLDELLAQPAP